MQDPAQGMVLSYKTVYKGGTAEIVEKKSRFIAHIAPAGNEEEAVRFIEEKRKAFWDARHNCHAFTVGLAPQMSRCSDDGEPAQTAGKPMLDVLLGAGLKNTVVVVTRYFGGTLLGTGGLVRAYSGAVQAALAASVTGTRTEGVRLRIRSSYNDAGKIRYLLEQRLLPITDIAYTDLVETETLVQQDAIGSLKAAVTEKTNARAAFPLEEKVLFALTDQGPVLL